MPSVQPRGLVSLLAAAVQSGKARILATTGTTRSPHYPEVPTFKEQGVNLVASEWYVLLAPAKTPKPIIDKLNAEIRKIMAIPNIGEKLPGIELYSSTEEEAKVFVASEIARWQPVITKLGLKLD